MPSPSDFRRAFGLECGPLPGNGTDGDDSTTTTMKKGFGSDKDRSYTMRIEDCRVGHDVITSFERYEFPIMLHITMLLQKRTEMSPSCRTRRVLQRLHLDHSGNHIVYSNYGSPYECTIPSDKWRVVMMDNSSSSLSHDPQTSTSCTPSPTTIRFECSNRGKAIRRRDIPSLKASTINEEDEAAVAHLKGLGEYRVIKSHFSSGKCACCGQKILSGAPIAHKHEARGWSHVTCLLKATTGQQRSSLTARTPPDAPYHGDTTTSYLTMTNSRQRKRKASSASKQYNLRPRRSPRNAMTRKETT